MMTEPSLRWRFTFCPMCERAMFKSILFIQLTTQYSPLQYPPSSGDRWAGFGLCTEYIPQCSCCCIFHSMDSCRIRSFCEHLWVVWVCELVDDLRSPGEQHLIESREFNESETPSLESFASPSVVGTLTPAIETSFHGTTSTFSIVERSRPGSSSWALSQRSDASKQQTAQQTNKLLAERRLLKITRTHTQNRLFERD